MNRRQIERRLGEVHSKLLRAREELAVAEEQLSHLSDDADDMRIRSLVSETPLAEREWQEANRHAEIMRKSRDAALERVAELERSQDDLLTQLVV